MASACSTNCDGTTVEGPALGPFCAGDSTITLIDEDYPWDLEEEVERVRGDMEDFSNDLIAEILREAQEDQEQQHDGRNGTTEGNGQAASTSPAGQSSLEGATNLVEEDLQPDFLAQCVLEGLQEMSDGEFPPPLEDADEEIAWVPFDESVAPLLRDSPVSSPTAGGDRTPPTEDVQPCKRHKRS